MKQGLDPKEVERIEQERQVQRLQELERIKEKRRERDLEEEAWEKEKRRMEMENENWSYKEWLAEEKAFHMKQALERAEIRLREGRPKPIDILHKNLQVDTKYDFEMRPPHEILAGLHVNRLQELEADIDMYLELSPEDGEFWKALKLLCQEQTAMLQGKRERVSQDVLEVFQGQNLDGLKELQKEIAAQMEEGEDPEYWDSLDKRCRVEIARATLSKIHAEKLQARLARIEDEKRAAERDRLEAKLRDRMSAQVPSGVEVAEQEQEKDDETKAVVAGESGKKKAKSARGRFNLEELVEDEVEGLEEEEAGQDARIRQLELEARKIESALELRGGVDADLNVEGEGNLLSESELIKVEMDRAADDNEEKFADEVDAGAVKVAAWHDKYTPRRPKYFNRVRTGYEWNKYNSTHYDKDNPPPKVVFGYRFNIFYTELVDPTKTPTFKVEPIPGNHDWVILRFKAGPPYLDVAFKIVNKPWETDSKYGYKAVFDKGVLRLWFQFKKMRYKR